MAQQETEHLSRILTSAALSRAVCSIAELGVADSSKPASRSRSNISRARAKRMSRRSTEFSAPGEPRPLSGNRESPFRSHAAFGRFADRRARLLSRGRANVPPPVCRLGRLASLDSNRRARVQQKFSARPFSTTFRRTRKWARSSTPV